ncbi:MAG TPA: hypothetical protein DCS67_11585 [Clostridiales bacterium UBA8960]|nr:hypothetical protein [Clostridiales bacterium UBA8960]
MTMKETEDKIKVIERVKKSKLVPHNVIGIIENTDDKMHFDETTGSVWVEHGYFNYVTGDHDVICGHLQSREDGFYGFSAVEGELAKAIYKDHFLHWCEPTERYVYGQHSVDIDALLKDCPYEIVNVPMGEAQGIDDRYEYQQEGSLERFKDAILNRPTSAIYLDGELASYVLVHEDHSIGYMFTLDKFRHKGLGYWVTLDILNKMTARGLTAFVEITMKNFKSQGLATKTGFVKEAYTPWFGIIKGFPDWFNTWNPIDGESFIFTSLAQLRFKDHLSWQGDEIQFVKKEDAYLAISKGDAGMMRFSLTPEASKEAYVLKRSEGCRHTLLEILSAIAMFFPEQNASLVMPYDLSLEGRIGGFWIKR